MVWRTGQKPTALAKQQSSGYILYMKILVIEDEPKIARALKTSLEQENYTVDVCHNSDDGYVMASTEEYDVMIVDRMLPGKLDGISIVKNIRSANIHTPVLLLTALGTTTDKTVGLDSGADDYLVKPFSIDELLARIRALLRRPKNQHSNTLHANGVSLNRLEKTVFVKDQIISLTNKEYSILEYLLRNKNRILTKDNIISNVWNYNADVSLNTVEANIKTLRSKLDKPFNTNTIETVRGFGYRIRDSQ